jgi:hypothetical protein
MARAFLDDKLDFELAFLYANTNDVLANNPQAVQCTIAGPGASFGSVAYVNQGCYGTRAGAEYETGLTISYEPSPHWFMFVDYRLVADTSGGLIAPAAPPLGALPQPTILTHALLLRLEARY